ncbi:MAG: EAL domain-containing protein [Arenicellales bacterium]
MSDDSYQIKKRTGEVLFREGDLADCAYIVEEGCVEVSVAREDTQVVLAELGPGEILGEMAVIDQFNRTATAIVTADCRLTVVTPSQIRQRIVDADPVVHSLIEILLRRYRSELTRAGGIPVEAASAFVFHSRGIQKIRLENELMRALETGDIKVVYQPIRRLKDGIICGFEALVRWDHPKRGTIPPEELISLAEETDLIVPLGLHVFEVAVRDRGVLRAACSPGPFMSVNVSAKLTCDQAFLDQAGDICRRTGETPQEIMLELTESSSVDVQRLGEWVVSAKDMGFQITVDDFGTGYASLEYLTRLAPNVLKIDQRFVRPIVEDPRTAAVLLRVVQMARDLGVQVIAEGAESPQHVRMLEEVGCEMAQGYEIGRPVTRMECLALLRP